MMTRCQCWVLQICRSVVDDPVARAAAAAADISKRSAAGAPPSRVDRFGLAAAPRARRIRERVANQCSDSTVKNTLALFGCKL